VSDSYVGEIRLFAGDFVPEGWAPCDGSELPIASNGDLFGLLGTTFGGDGLSTFAVPDLRGRVPVHIGQAPGMSSYALGAAGGSEAHTLTPAEIPAHTHAAAAKTTSGSTPNPGGNVLAGSPNIDLFVEDEPTVSLAAETVGTGGEDAPHDNLMPFVALNYIIATGGFAE
jgi:microcystin-dependent protein